MSSRSERAWAVRFTTICCKVWSGEPSLATVTPGDRCQFERIGYFSVDSDSRPGSLVFNRTVGLRDTWAKIEEKLKTGT